MKKALCIVFIGITTFGFGQSKRAINKQLKAQYQLLDTKLDSLADVYAFEKVKEMQAMDSLRIHIKDAYDKQREFNGLINDLAQKSSDLKLLGIKLISGMDISFTDSLVQKMSGLTIESIVREMRNDQFTGYFGFSKYEITELDNYSKKDQNALLKMLIKKREEEQEMMTGYVEEIRKAEPVIHRADSALNFLNLYKEFMIPNINSILELLDKELSNQRLAYMKNGPAGFPLSYHRVFPDVFPETGPDIDFNNQLLDNGPIPVPEEIFTVVDEEARFPGENSALMDYTRKNLQFPEEAMKLGLEGKCYVKFVVFSSGDIGNVIILKGVPDCESCDKEAIRFIESMPVWIPAKVNGRPVNSYVILPLVFQLN